MHFETRALQATRSHDKNASAVATPIYLSTTFERDDDNQLPHGYIYSRTANPNRTELEQAYATLEGGAVALAFASGQAATTTLLQCLRPHDHVIIPDDAYFGTPAILQTHFEAWGLTFSKIDMTDLGAVAAALRPNTRLVWVETPSNPLLKITDLQAIADLCRAHQVLCVCDNTWATPVLQRPIEHGFDVVMHATTKYFGGHSDLLSGCLVFKEDGELAQRARQLQNLGGAVPSPFDCWLLLRGIKTLALRVRQQSANAAALAAFLATHPRVAQVNYPGLSTHPNHLVAQRQMQLPGAMLSVQLRGGAAEALRVKSKVQLFIRATSLGGVESLIEHRATAEGALSTSPPNLLRISTGLEHPDDLIADLAQALDGYI
jgi:cystathionine gamma-synthase